jgi:uncharacterized damage-inducible protein DinB
MEINTIVTELKTQAILRMNENTPRIEKCLLQLSEEEVWQAPNAQLSSIGNLILHLCGNITQYIIASIGKQEDKRERHLEFAVKGGYTKAQLLQKISKVLLQANTTIMEATPEELLRVRNVQGFAQSGWANIIHVAEHYSYHTGQIAFFTKLLKGVDLEFYGGFNLNAKNG